ncbi:hypothetical protein ACFQ60_47355 [Streptomyces zhihengii]
MRITVTIDQPGSEFQEKLLALLAEHAVHVEMDAMWTAERAQAYYRSLPTRARRIVAGAVAGDGYVAAEDLRDDESTSLRGHSAALKRLLQRGALRGMWPEGIQPPITPQGPGFGKVGGYAMDEDLVPVFFAALTSVEDEHEVGEAAIDTGGSPGGRDPCERGWRLGRPASRDDPLGGWPSGGRQACAADPTRPGDDGFAEEVGRGRGQRRLRGDRRLIAPPLQPAGESL